MLGVSQTLHNTFIYGMLFQGYWTTLHKIFSYAMLSGASRTTLQEVFPVQCCPRRYSWDNITQTKPCAALPKMFQITFHRKKFLFNIAVILLGQHCTGQNPMQCCPRGSRHIQHITEKQKQKNLSIYIIYIIYIYNIIILILLYM